MFFKLLTCFYVSISCLLSNLLITIATSYVKQTNQISICMLPQLTCLHLTLTKTRLSGITKYVLSHFFFTKVIVVKVHLFKQKKGTIVVLGRSQFLYIDITAISNNLTTESIQVSSSILRRPGWTWSILLAIFTPFRRRAAVDIFLYIEKCSIFKA